MSARSFGRGKAVRRLSRGTALVETALSLSIVLLGIFTAVQFDYASFTQLQLDEMSQLGARRVGTAGSIAQFISSAGLGIQAANVTTQPAADGHVPLQVVSIAQRNLPSYFGLLSPSSLQSQSAELQFSGNFSGRDAGAYPEQQADGFFFDAQANLEAFGGYPFDVPCIPPARSGGYPESPPPAPITLELPLLVNGPSMPGHAAGPALPAVTRCTNQSERPLGLFTRVNGFGNGNLTMDDYINELACHTAWHLYFANNMQVFDFSTNNVPVNDPSTGGWLYGVNPMDYQNNPPAYPNAPHLASWIDMVSDMVYVYSLDSGPPLDGKPYVNCNFPMWFSYIYDSKNGGFPGADVSGQAWDIWPPG